MDLDKGIFPGLHLQGQQLPFTEEDVGVDVKIRAVIRLTSIKYQGYNYNFEMTEIDFPGKVLDKGTTKARKRTRNKKMGIITKPILDESSEAKPKKTKEKKYKSWLERRKK